MKFCIVCLESRKIIVQICDIIIYQEPNICNISCDLSLYTSTPIYGLFKSYPIVLHFSQVLSESRRQSVLPPQSLQSESWAGQKVVDKYLGDRQFWPYRWRGSLSFYNVFTYSGWHLPKTEESVSLWLLIVDCYSDREEGEEHTPNYDGHTYCCATALW